MKLFVHYNREGEIRSVSKIAVMPEHLTHPQSMPGEEEFVLNVTLKEGASKRDALQIHQQYEVDVDRKKLVKDRFVVVDR